MPVVGILGCGRHLDVVVLAPEPAVSQPNAFERLLLSEVTFFAAALLSWGWGFPWPPMRNKLALENVLPPILSSNLPLFTALCRFSPSPLSTLSPARRLGLIQNISHFLLGMELMYALLGESGGQENVSSPRRKCSLDSS